MGASTKLSLEERIDGLVHDAPDILYTLSRLEQRGEGPIEMVTDLPAAQDVDIILGYIQRWAEIQKHFDRELRIYAWSYNTEVEKYVLGCTLHMPKINITVLPMYLKEGKLYA